MTEIYYQYKIKEIYFCVWLKPEIIQFSFSFIIQKNILCKN